MNEIDKLPQLTTWPVGLILELSLGLESEGDILERYDISQEQYLLWLDNVAFRKELTEVRKQVVQDGLTFKLKAKVQAEEYLKDLHVLMRDPSTPIIQKLSIMRDLVRWGGLEPKEEKQSAVNVQVNTVGTLIQAVSNTSRDLVRPEVKELRAKSWKE